MYYVIYNQFSRKLLSNSGNPSNLFLFFGARLGCPLKHGVIINSEHVFIAEPFIL